LKGLGTVEGLPAHTARAEADRFATVITMHVFEEAQHALEEAQAVVEYEQAEPFRAALDKGIIEAEELLRKLEGDSELEAVIALAKEQAEISRAKDVSK